MNMPMSLPATHKNNGAETPVAERHHGKAPVCRCPVCDHKALTRSSEEISPTYRRLYYVCQNIKCGMTWVASLAFEKTLSPSGLGEEFRPAKVDQERPPGHDFGQTSIFDMISASQRD